MYGVSNINCMLGSLPKKQYLTVRRLLFFFSSLVKDVYDTLTTGSA